MMGGGTGPAAGTTATTWTPGPWHIQRMLEASVFGYRCGARKTSAAIACMSVHLNDFDQGQRITARNPKIRQN
jgi:hypothetical protein